MIEGQRDHNNNKCSKLILLYFLAIFLSCTIETLNEKKNGSSIGDHYFRPNSGDLDPTSSLKK